MHWQNSHEHILDAVHSHDRLRGNRVFQVWTIMMINKPSRLLSYLLLAALGCGLISQTASAQPGPRPDQAFAGNLPWDMRQQYYEQLPPLRDDNIEQTPFERLLGQMAQQSWIKVDYVNWNLGKINNDLVGSPVPGVPRPDFGYTIADSSTGVPATDADDAELINYTPRLGGLNLNHRNGLRLTYGLETNYGTLEANAMWILQDDSSFVAGPPFPYRSNQVIRDPFQGANAIPFSLNGQPATTAVVFNDRMTISYSSEVFGSEINFIADDHRPQNGFHFKPLLGFRYFRLNESMALRGTTVATDTAPGGAAAFNSTSLNQVMGPQIGANAELSDEVFTLGARSAFTFGFNHTDVKVLGNNPQAPFDTTQPLYENKDNYDVFAPVVSLALYTQIRLWERVKLYGSYDLLFLGGMSRAYETILYDSGSSGNPGFGTQKNTSNMLNQGFSVGMLFEF